MLCTTRAPAEGLHAQSVKDETPLSTCQLSSRIMAVRDGAINDIPASAALAAYISCARLHGGLGVAFMLAPNICICSRVSSSFELMKLTASFGSAQEYKHQHLVKMKHEQLDESHPC